MKRLLHCRLVEKIGEGGMGVVWKALETTLNRDVAIKILPDLFSDHPERLGRFEREAKLLASPNHPNIAGIYGIDEAAGTRFLTWSWSTSRTCNNGRCEPTVVINRFDELESKVPAVRQ